MAADGDQIVSAVSLKLPEFWINSPEVWFARVEAQFGTKKITEDQTKYDYTVSALDFRTAEEVQGLLINPPDNNKYLTLKQALIKAFGKSQAQKDAELLNFGGLGDRRPTALLRKINALNDDPITLKRALFLLNLPTDLRSILVGQDFPDIDKMAEAADRIWETRASSSTISEISHSEQVNAFSRPSFSNKQPSFSYKQQKRLPRKDNPSAVPPPDICYYHLRFGSKARRCDTGCKFADLIPQSASNSTVSGNDTASRK